MKIHGKGSMIGFILGIILGALMSNGKNNMIGNVIVNTYCLDSKDKRVASHGE